ncbi:MAG: NAD(P)/FAD-dependent oxidoreductase [Nitrososphaerales archaeon]
MVVGWRDLAMNIALSYSDIAYKVYMSYKTGNLLGDDKLKEKIKVKENVELIPSSQVMEIKGEERVESVVLQNLWKNEKKEVKIDGVFVALDYVEKTDFLKGLVEFNAVGKIVVDKGCSTSRLSVFAAGGITDNPSKQIAIPVG